MSAKKDGRGMLDMLERIGMIKKTDDGVTDEPFSQNIPQDISREISQETGDQQEETTVYNGFWDDTPVYPILELETAQENPEYTDVSDNLWTEEELSGDYDNTASVDEPVTAQEHDIPASDAPVVSEPPLNKSSFFTEMSKKSEIEQIYRVSDKVMSEKSFWEDNETALLNVDKSLDVPALYSTFGLPASGTNTIYIIEEYLKTLPDSLPSELRRSIILKIVAASGFDFDKLLNDGIDRVSKLNEYAEMFSRHTEDILAKYNSQVEDLERQIQSIKESMNARKNLHKQQFLVIEGEAQRLKEVLDFVTK